MRQLIQNASTAPLAARNKIAANRKRDRYVNRKLRSLGWQVVRIWQHQLDKPARVAGRVIRALESPESIMAAY